jgi:hypothetical protein
MRRFQNPLHLLLCLILFLGAAFTSPLVLHGQTDFQKAVRHQGQSDRLYEAAVLDTYGVAGLGFVGDTTDGRLLVLSDYDGDVIWERSILNHPTTTLAMRHMCVEGYSIFVSGDAYGDTTAAMIYKFSRTGNLDWVRFFSHTPAPCVLTCIAGDQNGNVIFGGQEQDSLFNHKGMVGKIRGSDGAPMWIRTFDDTLKIEVHAIASTPSGEVVAAGHTIAAPNPAGRYPYAAKWDANGNLLWSKRLSLQGQIKSLRADANHIYVGGENHQSGQFFVGQLSHQGSVMKWATLNHPNHTTTLEDMELKQNHIRLTGFNDVAGPGVTNLLMRLDSNLVPVWAWEDHYARPLALAGTNQQDMLHFVGAYYDDPQYPACILLGAIPDMPLVSAPCGMTALTPVFDNTLPTVVNYPVVISNRVKNGWVMWTTYAVPLVPVADCGTSTGVKESPEILDAGEMRVWPNPVTGVVHVSLPDRECKVTCMDLQGKVMLHATGSGQVDLDMGHLPEGMYMMVVERGEKRWARRVCKAD